MDTATIFIMIATALLSSIFTISLSLIAYRVFIKKSLKNQLEEAGELVKSKMQEGVLQSARELLPEFREEVSEGFKEALADSLSGDVVHRTAMSMAKNSTSMVEQGLNLLMGKPQNPKP